MTSDRGGSPFFGRRVPFSEAFPQIESAEFRYVEWPVEHEASDDGKRFSQNPGEFIPCGNPRCRNEWGSGLPAGEILREMVRDSLETFETSKTCMSVERGRHPQRCLRRFRDIQVTVRYRASE